MLSRLKHFRVATGATQAAIAKALGVTQPTYQRWESGSANIPDAKLATLATVLGTTQDNILGRHPPIRASFYDDSAPDYLQYYGEIAIHFRGGGSSLLLSISERARKQVFNNMHLDARFLIVQDLGNRTVIIRASSISDVYMSSEAYDDYGPEHNEPGYKEGTPLHLPDPRDWEIIESFAHDGVGIEDFDDKDVKRIESTISVSDDQYQKLLDEGFIKPEELEAERINNSKLTNAIISLATSLTYQLSNGTYRCIDVIDCELYDIFGDIIDDENDILFDRLMIVIQSEGYHRAVCLNPEAIDYISIPTHLLLKSRDNVLAATIDEK